MSFDDVKKIIKDSPISTIIGSYIPLTKKGANLFAICPFHDDHNPSMSVHDGKGLFRCFVCGTSGDAIKFVELYRKCDFKEAMKEIAEKLHLSLDFLDQDSKKSEELRLAEKVALAASQLYFKVAQTSQMPEYLDFLKKRHIIASTAQTFQLGLAQGNTTLVNYLHTLPEHQKSKAIEMAQTLGLIRKNEEKGNYYDTFRNRIVFPIWNASGKVVGFSSRALFEYQMKRKYVNSQESLLFQKKNILYGLNLAKESIRDKNLLIMVEGQMDVLALHQYGIKYCVAISGTAFNPKLIETMGRLSKNIYFALDSDHAGLAAMKRMLPPFLEEGINPKFIDHAPFKDADELLQAQGTEELLNRIKTAPYFLESLLERTHGEKNPQTLEDKIKFLEEAFELLAPLKKHLFATEMIISLAQKLELQTTPDFLVKSYEDFLRHKKGVLLPKHFEAPVRGPQTPKQQATPVLKKVTHSKKEEAIFPADRKILISVLEHPDLFTHEEFLELLDFVEHNEVKRLVQKIKELYFEVDECDFVKSIETLITTQEHGPALKRLMEIGLTLYRPTPKDGKKVSKLFRDLKSELEIVKLKKTKAIIRNQLNKAQDQEERFKLLSIQINIERDILKIKTRKYLPNSGLRVE